MKLIINGANAEYDKQTLAEVLVLWGAQPPFVVAVNKTFVPKHQWPTTSVKDNDVIDILSPISGG